MTSEEAIRNVIEFPPPGAEAAPKEVALPDMPVEVLDGWLGDICREQMADFPIAYAWPALLGVASALVSRGREKTRANLYVALVGPVGTAKSAAIARAIDLMGIQEPVLMDTVAGSAEGLMSSTEVSEADGEPRLYSPDELGHLLEKAKIENSSYAYILNMAFYKTKFKVIMAKGKETVFNAALSIAGGLVDERFQDLFGSLTTGGMYDRFIYGLCPTGFVYEYWERETPTADVGIEFDRPVRVSIDREVWDVYNNVWRKEFTGRVPELALRVAVICASFSRQRILTAADLAPAYVFARYQERVRKLLKPNPGKNADGIAAFKFLEYLRNRPNEWVNVRSMFRDTNAYDLGPGCAQRCLNMLQFIGEVETKSDESNKRKILVRIAANDSPQIIPISESKPSDETEF
jgi:hypothetical protein